MSWVTLYVVAPDVKVPVAVVPLRTVSHDANEGAEVVCFTRGVSVVPRTVGSVKLAPEDRVVAIATSISLLIVGVTEPQVIGAVADAALLEALIGLAAIVTPLYRRMVPA